jgi:branched-chain amino acid transport system substrate-binding protein
MSEEGRDGISRRQFLKYAGAAGATLTVAGGLGGLVAACGGEKTTTTSAQKAGAAGDVIQIGVMVAMTNWFSSYDMSEYEEASVVAEQWNAAGGITIDGKKYSIELVPEDVRSSLDGTTAAANKLAYDKKVKFVAGPQAFFNSASSPTFEQAKVMHLMTWCTMTPPEISKDTKYAFVGHNSIMGCVDAQSKVYRKLFPDAKTYVEISPDDGAPQYFAPKLDNIMKINGFTPGASWIGYPNEIVDFAPIAAKLNAANVDIGFHCNGTPTHAANMLKAVRSSGNTKPYGGVIGAAPEDLVKVCGKDLATDFLQTSNNPKSPENSPQLQAMCDELLKRWGETRTISIHQASGVYNVLSAIKSAGSLDPDDVIAWWEKADTMETLCGPGNIGGQESYGIRHAVGHPQYYDWIVKGEVAESGWTKDVKIP